MANLVTGARISADLYRRQLRPVPARLGKKMGKEEGEVAHGRVSYVYPFPWRRGTRGII